MTVRTLCIVVCGAPLAARTGDGVQAARTNGWDPYVIPTDAALPWLDGQDLFDASMVTGNRAPGQAKRTPPADAVVVVPTTFNTLNAWANGNAYSYPVTVLCVAAEVPWRDEDLLARCLIGLPATPRGPLSVRC
ncbi:flavoprotein [Kribbella sp. NPDC056951]|uniref:flavoprotein n=1 Tax=Kribbella sp. NPDC056951 TaxID=3345978 RepID=UPI00362E944B